MSYPEKSACTVWASAMNVVTNRPLHVRRDRDKAGLRRACVPLCTFLVALLFCCHIVCAASESPADTLLRKQAPSFARQDLKNNRVDIAALRGKVVLLTFWATWCAPCQLEMPHFVEWQSKYGPQGLQIVGVSMDDDEPPVRAIMNRKKLNYPIIMGDEKLGTLYGGILGLPVTYLIDRKGVIRRKFRGETNLDQMEKAVTAMLANH